MPDGASTSKKNETYDCCEIEEILKTYESIKHKLDGSKAASKKNSDDGLPGLQITKQVSTPSSKARKALWKHLYLCNLFEFL